MGEEELKDFIDNARENWQNDLATWSRMRVYGTDAEHPGTLSEYLAAALAPLVMEWV